MLPPWPGWDGLHPLVIHFPIALFFVAPLFVALAVLRPAKAVTFAVPALVLLVLGTVAAFVSVETGEAAAELATRTDDVNRVLERHAGLAENVRNLFTLLTLVYGAAIVAIARVQKLARPAYVAAIHAVFLVLLLAGAGLVAAAAHQGGILVHGLGVHSMVAVPPAPGSVP